MHIHAECLCPICGRRESAAVTIRSRRVDVGGQRWGLTDKGAALLATWRAEQSTVSACALCGQAMDPLTPADRAALGDTLLVCWDCWCETGAPGGKPC
jgi:hypothetical protein